MQTKVELLGVSDGAGFAILQQALRDVAAKALIFFGRTLLFGSQ